MYDFQNYKVFVTKDSHFNNAYCNDKINLTTQDFADYNWHKADDELFVDSQDIFHAGQPIRELNNIPHWNLKTYPNFEELHTSSFRSDIPNLVKDKKVKNDDGPPKDQPTKKTKEKP